MCQKTRRFVLCKAEFALRGVGWRTFLLREQDMKKHFSQPHFMIGAAIDIKPIAELSPFLA